MHRIIRGAVYTMGLITLIGSLFGCTNKPETTDTDNQGNVAVTGTGTGSNYGPEGSDGAGEGAVSNESGIEYFSYSYNASIGADSYSYTITKDEDGIELVYESMEEPEYGEMSVRIDQTVLDELDELCRSLKIAEWDGYQKSDPYALDGDGFSLNIRFADKGKIRAGGTNAFPKRYRDFKTRMLEILEPIKDRIKEEKRQEVIKEGLHGTLNSILATFIQHGSAGSDEYHILIMTGDQRKTNYEVRVKSVSGDFFPVGEYNVYRSVPDEVLNLARVQELAEKYSLIEWYGFEGVAEDPNNEEWYQLDMDFGEMCISSIGTVHPVNYDEFRRELFEWLKETADAVAALPADE